MDMVTSEAWHSFNMHRLQEELEKGTLKVANPELLRIIKGYDLVIVIPTVSAARFPTTD